MAIVLCIQVSPAIVTRRRKDNSRRKAQDSARKRRKSALDFVTILAAPQAFAQLLAYLLSTLLFKSDAWFPIASVVILLVTLAYFYGGRAPTIRFPGLWWNVLIGILLAIGSSWFSYRKLLPQMELIFVSIVAFLLPFLTTAANVAGRRAFRHALQVRQIAVPTVGAVVLAGSMTLIAFSLWSRPASERVLFYADFVKWTRPPDGGSGFHVSGAAPIPVRTLSREEDPFPKAISWWAAQLPETQRTLFYEELVKWTRPPAEGRGSLSLGTNPKQSDTIPPLDDVFQEAIYWWAAQLPEHVGGFLRNRSLSPLGELKVDVVYPHDISVRYGSDVVGGLLHHTAEWGIPLRGIDWFMVRTRHTNCFTLDHHTYGWTLRTDAEEVYVVFDFTRFSRDDVFDLSERPRILLVREPYLPGEDVTDLEAWKMNGLLCARVPRVKRGSQLILDCKWRRASASG